MYIMHNYIHDVQKMQVIRKENVHTAKPCIYEGLYGTNGGRGIFQTQIRTIE